MPLLLATVLALTPAQRASVDAIVERVMRDEHVPGLSLGIARNGRTVYERGYGLRDVARGLAADASTVYRVGSIAKQFTAAMVVQDVANGTIAPDAPIRRYLPFARSGAGAVTVEQLLAQTGGISPEAPVASAETVAAFPLVAAPGTSWSYANGNYVLLGAILERCDGTALPELLHERVTGPLGLSATEFGTPPATADAARGYVWQDAWREVVPAGTPPPLAAAGLLSDVPDLLHWLDALRSGRVIAPAAFAEMTASAKLSDGVATNYGFGFFVSDWFGYRAVEHPGYVPGFSSEDALILDDGLEVVLLSNRAAVDLAPLAKSVVAAIDPPLDANLAAAPSRPPQNENLALTRDLEAIVRTPGFASLGALLSTEFVERSFAGAVTYDKYRLTFSSGQWWVTVGYRDNGPIETLTFSPVE